MSPPTPSRRRLSRAGVAILVIVLAVIAAIFVGRNLYHANTLDQQQAGHTDDDATAQTPHDLERQPARND